MTTNCPTCGRVVPTMYEHVDVSCENWPDRGEQLPQSYRGYGIDAGWFMGYDYIHNDYDGPEDERCGNEATLELCYRAIDERLND